ARGIEPAFGALRVVARAITPRRSPKRFHNRFFLADGNLARGSVTETGELQDLDWYPLREAIKLPMAEVGTCALREAVAHRLDPSNRSAARFLWIGRQMRPRHRQTAFPPGTVLP
ncbi:MAG: hypothetical protein R3245_08650, partial [Kiloniellales bacterium]|nr:hypothetical protein [Kiloniellales bacterium]